MKKELKSVREQPNPDIRGGAVLSEGTDGAKDTENKAVTVPFPFYRRNWHLAFSAFSLSFPVPDTVECA